MNNTEYLNALLGRFDVTPEEILVLLIENSIDPNGTVTGREDTIILKKAVFSWIPGMLAGLQSISEGGYSIKWNVEGIKLWYSVLAKELGLPDPFTPVPTITSPKVW